MAVTAIRWLRNNRDIARFLHLKLKRAQLEEIGEWIQEPAFPKKQKKGWPAAEVLAWANTNAPLIAAKKAHRAALSDALGNKKPSVRTLKLLGTDATNPPEPNANSQSPVWNGCKIPSQEAMANELKKHFGLPISRQNHIQPWTHGKKLPAAAKGRAFPAPDSGNGYSSNQSNVCFDWFRECYYNPIKAVSAATAGQGELSLEALATTADLEKVIDEARIKRMEADSAARELDERWILRERAEATYLQFVNTLRQFLKTEFERHATQERREQLRAIGVPDDLVTKFYELDMSGERARFDRILAQCAPKQEAD